MKTTTKKIIFWEFLVFALLLIYKTFARHLFGIH